jgi:RNA polymerase-binding transcription factor DksA
MSTRDAVRAQLEGRLATLLRRIGKIEGDLKQEHNRDSEERATELENDEVLEGLDEMTLEEIRQIRTALRNIETGTYGVCSACGRPIDSERLAAVPSAVTCVACTR